MFLLRDKLIKQGEKRETSTQNFQAETMLRELGTPRAEVCCIS